MTVGSHRDPPDLVRVSPVAFLLPWDRADNRSLRAEGRRVAGKARRLVDPPEEQDRFDMGSVGKLVDDLEPP